MAGSGELLVFVGTWSDDADEGIHTYVLNTSSGDLNPVSKAVANRPFHLTISKDQRFLYATSSDADAPDGSVVAFSIDESGELTRINEQPSNGPMPCYVSVNAANTHLLVGNYNAGNVALLPIQADGSLGAVNDTVQQEGTGPDTNRQSQAHPHCFQYGPGDRFAYSPDLGADKVFVYRVDTEAGKLNATTPVAVQPGAGPRHLNFHPNARFCYLINEMDSTINVYDYDADTGDLSEIQSITTLPEDYSGSNGTADVQLHPSGKFLYGTNRGHDSIAIFAVDEIEGSISFLSREPSRGEVPWSIAIDPSGSFIASANTGANNVPVFRIEPDTGLLQPVGTPASAGKPTCVKMLQR